MSQINVTTIKSRTGSAPNFPEGLTVAGISTFTAAVSIAGTLTYDDVTNVDAVGLITARSGINVSAGNIKVTAGIVTVGAGVTISSDFIHVADNSKINVGTGSDLVLYHTANHSRIEDAGTGKLQIGSDTQVEILKAPGFSESIAQFNPDGGCKLFYDNSGKIETISTGASVYGGIRLQGGGLMREHVNISGTALNSDKVINCSQGMVHYRSSAVGGANVKLNVISTAGINTDMAIGDIMTLTVITVAGSTSHFVDQLRIDGVEASAGVTTHWVGGSAPTDGGGSGVDTYAFNILKTGNATYVAVANQVTTS